MNTKSRMPNSPFDGLTLRMSRGGAMLAMFVQHSAAVGCKPS
jgi:hypothetical protein